MGEKAIIKGVYGGAPGPTVATTLATSTKNDS